MSKFLLSLIFLLAIFFRFNNLNWDLRFHLHPDERFLTMVGNAMKIPETFSDYLDPNTSTFNPANVGFKFYVYGVFPVILNKIVAVIAGNDDYNAFTFQGRFLSALADLLVVFLVFKTVELLEKKYKLRHKFKYWAAFFYAIAVLPIQLSHFFAVDTFLNLFMFASFYCILKSRETLSSEFKYILFSAVFFGLVIASKITAFFILPLNLLIIALSTGDRRTRLLGMLLFFLTVYVTLRFANPYMFENSNFFDPTPNKIFVENLQSLKSLEGKDIWYPPGIQWINKLPVIFSLVNLAIFGVGISYFVFILIGTFSILRLPSRRLFIGILFWVIIVFFYQASRFSQAMRYLVVLYPFLAIFSAYGMLKVKNNTLKVISIILLLIWPLMFSSIYLNKHSRVQASEWIYQNLPGGSIILSEHWDDALPLSMDKGRRYTVKELPVFAPDDKEKWNQMNKLLNQADYYVLSSNRGWGSIPSVPQKYPVMSKFYRDLLDGKTRYKKIKEL
ncbi:glycosyltransferase family 39 protein, partial [Candidatus Roizmanbacteria bacterium]|nr:glycosyltransferase family 39 protein [Candidatus Roizmanbacteria bacterium]